MATILEKSQQTESVRIESSNVIYPSCTNACELII